MSAGEQQHVSTHSPQAAHGPVSPGDDLGRRFPSRAAVAEQLPVGALCPNIGRPPSLILAVVPFQQIGIDFGDGPKAGQFTCPAGALQGTGKDLGERQSLQALLKPGGVALAALGQRQIGQACMLAREAPRGLTVPGQVNDGNRFAHAFLPSATLSFAGSSPAFTGSFSFASRLSHMRKPPTNALAWSPSRQPGGSVLSFFASPPPSTTSSGCSPAIKRATTRSTCRFHFFVPSRLSPRRPR